MNYQHKNLAQGRWFTFSLVKQLAHVGSEVERAINWRDKDYQYCRMAVDRALELMDLTIADLKNRSRLKELVRVRETLADYFYFDNIYGSTDESWHRYFYPFNYAASLGK